MNNNRSGSVIAQFNSASQVERAVGELVASGISEDDIIVSVRDPQTAGGVGTSMGANAGAGAAVGAVGVGIVGAVAGWMLTIGDVALPGQTPSSGIGSIAAAITGAALGVAIGGIIGALFGLRAPVDQWEPAQEIDDDHHAILMKVEALTEGDATRIEPLLSANGGHDVRAFIEPSLPLSQAHMTPSIVGEQGTAVPQALSDAVGADEPPMVATPNTNWTSARFPEAPAGRPTTMPTTDGPEDVDVGEVWQEDGAVTGNGNAEASLPHPPGEEATILQGSYPRMTAEGTQDYDAEADWYDGLGSPHTVGILSADEEASEGDAAPAPAGLHSKLPEELSLNTNPEGVNPNTVTGTQGAIDPHTGAYGTAGTPVTTGYGVSGSTIGSGTAAEEEQTQDGDFRGSSPNTQAYERGGRGSADASKLKPDEQNAPTEDKYGEQHLDAAPVDQQTPVNDIYTAGPSYGPVTTAGDTAGATEMYSDASVETPPTSARTATSETQTSAGTNIPGTENIQGLGDNTDDPNLPD